MRLDQEKRLERLLEVIEEKSEHSYLKDIKDAEKLFKDLMTDGLTPFEIVYVAHGVGVYHGDVRNTKDEPIFTSKQWSDFIAACIEHAKGDINKLERYLTYGMDGS